MSLGSVCRLLLARELQERAQDHLKDGDQRPQGLQSHVGTGVRYSQVCQGLQSSEGKLGESPDVVVLYEAGENTNFALAASPSPRPSPQR